MTDTYIIAGGGTGGHIFPALAIGRALLEMNSHGRIIFVGTPYGMEKNLIPKRGFPLLTLPMRGLLGKRLSQKLALMWRLPVSLLMSFWHLLKLRPKVVVGVGGYASLPMLLAATFLRFPTVIQEQNAYPGITNRLLSRFVKLACLGFSQAAEKLRCPCVVTGNPVRRSFFQVPQWDGNRTTVLVLGGSQGARILNENLPQMLKEALKDKTELKVVHQSGEAFVPMVRQSYEGAPMEVEVVDFVDDVPALLSSALVVICHAGASTVSELIAAGVDVGIGHVLTLFSTTGRPDSLCQSHPRSPDP